MKFIMAQGPFLWRTPFSGGEKLGGLGNKKKPPGVTHRGGVVAGGKRSNPFSPGGHGVSEKGDPQSGCS